MTCAPAPHPGAAAGGAATGRLPDLLLVGAAKAGSTTLAAALAAHPQLFLATPKELHFFDHPVADGGEQWYRRQFAGAGAGRLAGEATPTYLTAEGAAERMHALVPRARLLVILRHPVDRAYSHYWWRHAFERRSFAQAVADEMRSGTLHGYVGDGRYVHHLRRLCAHFPREQVHVLLLDDLRADAAATFARACRFLGVDDGVLPEAAAEVRNPAFAFRSRRLLNLMLRTHAWRRAPALAQRLDALNRRPLTYPPMDPGLRRELLDHLDADNRDLAAWLGRDLAVWDH